MVLQVAKDESKEKEFSEVNLPLPEADVTGEKPIPDEVFPPLRVKKKSKDFCKIFSVMLNAMLLIAVIMLAVKMCGLKKELDEFNDRDEFEITAKQANERDLALDLKGDIPRESHDIIQKMMADNNEGWFRNTGVKFYVCFQRRQSSSFWPW